MKEILLTQNKVALVSDSRYEWASQYPWSAYYDGHNWYAIRKEYDPITNKQINTRMHREIMNLSSGDKRQVDHIDGNGLNNQDDNLRICTHAQNSANRKKNRNNSSGYTGVYFNKAKRKWRAEIKVHNKTRFIGYFDSLDKAVAARAVAQQQYFGEFAPTRHT